jgi:hypothetical protein
VISVPKSEWEWFGNVAHFVCGQWCRFHLATKVGDHLVSTIGQFIHPRHSAGSERAEVLWIKDNPNGEEIGYGRTYETMVFKAGKRCEAPGCNCGLPAISGSELDFRGYNDPGAATIGHMELCEKWSKAND